MKLPLLFAVPLLGLTSSSLAENIPLSNYLWGEGGPSRARLERRTPPNLLPKSDTDLAERATCTNTATTRNCWTSGFDINTNYYNSWPNTGVTVNYNLQITNTTCNPDGNGARVCMLINNSYPGPTIVANWGDTLSITVRNMLQHNGTSIHWHGLRQLNSNIQDGANGITECSLAPGDSKTYTFQATEYGTSWYHSHFSAQYGDGVVGTIQINGPATANYDIDLGTYPVTDWYYKTAFQTAAISQQSLQVGGGPPPGDNILINGTNKNANGGGSYNRVTLTPGKKHRLRLINTSMENAIIVSLDNHPFSVIASDFVPINPFSTDWLLIGIGQRYDVIIQANQTTANYWFRANVQASCAAANNGAGLSIFSYTGAAAGNPTTTGSTAPTACQDASPLVPWVSLTVPSTSFANQVGNLQVDFGTEVSTNGQNVVYWQVNKSAIDINPSDPTIQYVIDHNTSYPRAYNLIEITSANTWQYWIIEEPAGTLAPIPHPIHLHGHDFFVLGTGSGTFSTSTSLSQLNFKNPPRRDVTFLPGGGWLVIAFPSDNPGAWLMHCHIGWHVSEGLSVQFLERKSEITLPATNSQWFNTCQNWKNYQQNHPIYVQDDSGL
ncbi:laccase-like multicopper oxidase [Glonium stellatum]|uniref:laccase n=1 Tax=Glonium stellatum TaxID=574774 RepID=A0A8E2JLY0_9PEZI|nr:laccase-like multicopper oxidase [Glonium stellatum]